MTPQGPRGSGPDTDVLPGERVDADIELLEGELDDVDAAARAQRDREPDGPAPAVVVFDVGEVLIDETRVWAVWAELLGVSSLTFAAVLGAAIAQDQDLADVFDHVAPNVDWRDFVEEFERRYGGFQPGDLYADAVPCLQELRQLGCTVAIAGNQPRRRSRELVALGVPHDAIATSEELGANKPDPAFFAAVLRLVQVSDPTEVLYVGDRTDNDVVPAAAAGLRTCWLKRGPWGLLQDLPQDVEPDIALEGLGELPLLLQEWRG